MYDVLAVRLHVYVSSRTRHEVVECGMVELQRVRSERESHNKGLELELAFEYEFEYKPSRKLEESSSESEPVGR